MLLATDPPPAGRSWTKSLLPLIAIGTVLTALAVSIGGMKIGQLRLFRLSSPAEHPYGSAVYGSRCQGQRGPTASRSILNFHLTPIPAHEGSGDKPRRASCRVMTPPR